MSDEERRKLDRRINPRNLPDAEARARLAITCEQANEAQTLGDWHKVLESLRMAEDSVFNTIIRRLVAFENGYEPPK